jgi:hypothetical protein
VSSADSAVNEQLGTTTVIITRNAAIAGADRVLSLGRTIVGEEQCTAAYAGRGTVVSLLDLNSAGYPGHARPSDHDCAGGRGGHRGLHRFNFDLRPLRAGRDRFYASARFPQVFVTLKRAPLSVVAQLREIPVAAVEPPSSAT